MKQRLLDSLERMQNQLLSSMKPEKQTGNLIEMTVADKKRLQQEIQTLTNRINGVKKSKIQVKSTEIVEQKNTWVIDIYAIKYGYQNKAAKKAAKKSSGSRKKMKRVKQMSLVKTVVLVPGSLQKYKDGLMGISPKNHVFKTRNTEHQSIPV